MKPDSQVKLSEEHIIPKGLGGNLVLPFASCEQCATNTGRFEQRLLRQTFRWPRGSLGIRSGRRRRQAQTHLPVIVGPDHDQKTIDLEISTDLPYWACMIETPGPPTIFHGEIDPENKYIASFIFSPWFKERFEIAPQIKVLGKQTIRIMQTFYDGNFCQLLAKIAHSFAVQTIGLGNFEPYLCEYITAKDPQRDFRYIGGISNNHESFALHELKLFSGPMKIKTILGTGEKEFIVCEINLLASYKSPTYLVVVGEPVR